MFARELRTLCFSLFVLLNLTGEAIAQAPQVGTAAPQGTYLKTCGAISFNGTNLSATCKFSGNHQSVTAINVKACEGDIWNDMGALRCYARTGTWGLGSAIPRGSYLQSCVSEFVKGTVLQATCAQKSKFAETDTRLDLKQCRMGSNISNIDGQLVCIN